MLAFKSVTGLFLLALIICGIQSSAQDRRFTVRDSIEMTTFSDPPRYVPGATPPTSPDGRYFVVVTSRGMIQSNQVETSMRLFRTSDVVRFVHQSAGSGSPPVSRVLVRIAEVPVTPAQSPYSPLISDIRWASDSRSLYFLADNAAGQHYLCNVDVESGRIATLSPRTNYDVERYSVLNGLVVFTATRSEPTQDNTYTGPGVKINADASVITGLPMVSILFPNSVVPRAPQFRELWMSRNGDTHKIPNTSLPLAGRDMARYLDVLSIAPNGRFVVKLNPVTQVPPSWQEYLPLPGFDDWRANLTNMSPANYWRPRQYVLVDLASGRSRPLLDAPFGDTLAHLEAAEAVWSKDSRRLLLTNTFLPLDGTEDSTRTQRTHLCTVADLELSSGATHCIAYTRDAENPTISFPIPLRLQDVSFGATSDDVVVHLGWPREGRWLTEWYRWSSGQWQLVKSASGKPDKTEPSSSETPSTLSITIKQDLNRPPVLWAKDTSTGTGKAIWNPNPQLATMKLGEASVYRWKDPSGNEFIGGLIKPVDYVPGQRYPLVIQTHGFQESEFLTDGPFPTAMAARALASAGIVVLQVGSNHLHYGELSEAHDQVVGYESAISKLAGEGLVDPKRVGIIGFSRTCWYVESALIEAPRQFAAASINDGIDQSYMQSMIFDPDNPSESQQIYRAKPFGEGLKEWMKLAPGFHLDKVTTPLMITAIKPLAILEEWEIYSSLYQQRKPVDFLYIPAGQHILQKPLDRLASQQQNVDWFRFWLKGSDDLKDVDTNYIERWRKQKAMRDAEDSAN